MGTAKIFFRLISGALLGVLIFSASVVAVAEELAFQSYKEVETLFQQQGYTVDAWQKGIRKVPRIYLSNIPSRWKNKYSKEISTANKKRLFFRLLGPAVLRSNELILADRSRLEAMVAKDSRNSADTAWLLGLAKQYKIVNGASVDNLGIEQLAELRTRVDIIPPSLVLAQAANESGWGTSRFADLGNALFGQWTYGGDGIPPREKRTGKGDYGIASFESPIDSVRAYMLNLNTHPTYAELRERRAVLRNQGNEPTGLALVDTLVDYSERGQAYVDEIREMIHYNHLEATDQAFLADEAPIILVPAGAGAN
ncbi:glucosaminidase domain-containing protein [Nitrosococcus watsonii]|uniref:Bax domain protein n=1 Tax=Nitrosococcus watsoni (strain C-113) TaxID=105559 RepID=D8KC67_NITWC|nr:glucosaminidase domain-containing protein [Nitrosococcus watsonii]ADJ29738.1 Bax domain protein [Nitrosococcus watsonii C-113]